jgi:hypothetical protein
MAEVDGVLKGLVVDELRRGSDAGDFRSRAQLQQACGVGAGDLGAILDSLRAEGVASELAPDEWALADSPAAGGEAAAVPEVEEEEPGRPGGQWEPPELPGRPRVPRVEGEESRVTLTQGVAGALDEQALGALVKAGIDEAKEASATFVFEVTP